MKLTRSKISKLYNKRRQSLKRAKKGKPSSNKRRTFRNKKRFDLSRKTLKKHRYQRKGGAEEPKDTLKNYEVKQDVKPEIISPLEESDPSKSPISPAPETYATVTEEPAPAPETTVTEEPAPAPETPATVTEEPAPEAHVDDAPILDADVPGNLISPDEMKNMYIEQSDAPEESNPVSSVEEQPDAPEESNPVSSVEEPTLEKLAPEEKKEPIIEEESTASSEAHLISSDEQNKIQETDKPNKEELVQSLKKVVDYITDVVADRVSEKVVSSQSGEQQPDGFAAVNEAAEIMASSGGKPKFKKTRKFRLTKGQNKTKTKHII